MSVDADYDLIETDNKSEGFFIYIVISEISGFLVDCLLLSDLAIFYIL